MMIPTFEYWCSHLYVSELWAATYLSLNSEWIIVTTSSLLFNILLRHWTCVEFDIWFDFFKFMLQLIWATLYYYVGEINLRTNRRRESEKKFGGVKCLASTTCGNDNLDQISHIQTCPGYRTRMSSDATEDDLGQYLVELHRERVQRWNSPLLQIDVGAVLLWQISVWSDILYYKN